MAGVSDVGGAGGVGILIGVAYTLRVLQKAFFGEADEADAAAIEHHPLPPISVPERIGRDDADWRPRWSIGLFPRLLLDLIVPSFNSPLFDGCGREGDAVSYLDLARAWSRRKS